MATRKANKKKDEDLENPTNKKRVRMDENKKNAGVHIPYDSLEKYGYHFQSNIP